MLHLICVSTGKVVSRSAAPVDGLPDLRGDTLREGSSRGSTMLVNQVETKDAKQNNRAATGTLRAVEGHELQQVDGGWVAVVGAIAWGAAYAYGVYRTFD
jgi:hypothetical protein